MLSLLSCHHRIFLRFYEVYSIVSVEISSTINWTILLSSLYEAFDIFEEASQINKMIDDVIVTETNLYAQQKEENCCNNNSEV